jgi:hypothetical protein
MKRDYAVDLVSAVEVDEVARVVGGPNTALEHMAAVIFRLASPDAGWIGGGTPHVTGGLG